MNTFIAAAIQLNSQPDVMHNLKVAGHLVEQAANDGAKFVGLPENFAFLGDEAEKHRQTEVISEHVMKRLPQWAKKYNITLLAGGFPVRAESGKVYNRAMIIDSTGNILGNYDKIHLFDISLSKDESYRESELVEAGKPNAVLCNTDFGMNACIGLSICYDVRFPELYRMLSKQGADVLCIPAAFTRPTGEAHWETLLRARAIENSAYVIAPAQTGKHGKKRVTYGHSMIIDPWGKVIADAGTESGIILADIDLVYLQDIRKKLPSLQHRVL